MDITWELNGLARRADYTIKKSQDDTFTRSFTTPDKTSCTIEFTDELADIATSYYLEEMPAKTLSVHEEFTPNITLIKADGAQLVIAYNPELTSLKSNYVDTITPTLGSPYPVVRRSGHQKYRTFSIGGMFAADENVDFNLVIPNGLDSYAAAAYRERLFKEEALRFLYAAEPLLCKSGPEGNMIVRLSNIALTSNKQLDRNLYSFTATATEVMDCADENWRALRGNDYVDVFVS